MSAIYKKFCPAKINLSLVVTGQREDGFHELVSLVVLLDFGDELCLELSDTGEDQLSCSDPDLPVNDNLVLRAARLFRKHWDTRHGFNFDLTKNIPTASGLGGGSSDAVAALHCLNEASGQLLDNNKLLELAAELGSDCPLFVDSKPVIMRGRGEILEAMSDEWTAGLFTDCEVLLFKPDFSIATQWAYNCMRQEPSEYYCAPDKAEAAVRDFQKCQDWRKLPLINSFEKVVMKKYLALAILLNDLRNSGVHCLMSGSGSCCFALVDKKQLQHIIDKITDALGSDTFIKHCHIMI